MSDSDSLFLIHIRLLFLPQTPATTYNWSPPRGEVSRQAPHWVQQVLPTKLTPPFFFFWQLFFFSGQSGNTPHEVLWKPPFFSPVMSPARPPLPFQLACRQNVLFVCPIRSHGHAVPPLGRRHTTEPCSTTEVPTFYLVLFPGAYALRRRCATIL